MVNLAQVESLVNDYVSCWARYRPTYTGTYEDNDFSCEGFQIFRNGFEIEDFNHDELSQLAILLTQGLRGQINRDHKIFWSWCAALPFVFQAHTGVNLVDDDWVMSFCNLVNLLLTPVGRGNAVNEHLNTVPMYKWQLAGPHTYSVLEGLLRRKNKDYVQKDGKIIQTFTITNPLIPTGVETLYANTRLNRINKSLRCFEECVCNDRGRACIYLPQIKAEIAILYPSNQDVYDDIDIWRNELIHGEEYWQNRVPILTNLLCLLLIDGIEPNIFNTQYDNLRTHANWLRTKPRIGFKVLWELFPPDFET